jgi:hypothetical protein
MPLFLSAPTSLSATKREILPREEGWIAGIGHYSLGAAEQAA